MTRWLPDDGPLNDLAACIGATLLPAGKLEVMDAVANGATQQPSGQRAALLARVEIGAQVVERHAVLVGTDADDYLHQHLRRNVGSSTSDLGEHESIAWCHCNDSEIVFVTQDKGAAYLALVELGPGRVTSPFDCWHDLLVSQFVDPTLYDALCEATARQSRPNVKRPKRLP